MPNLDRPAVSQTSLFSRVRIRFRARTPNRWIDGVLITAHRRLSDAVNREDSGGVLVADEIQVYEQGGSFGGESQQVEFGCINLASVLFFVPVTDGPPPPRDSFAMVKTRSEPVRVGIGPYEIEGRFFLIADAKVRDAIASPKPAFLGLKSATVRQVDGAGSAETFDSVLVNRRLMDYIVSV